MKTLENLTVSLSKNEESLKKGYCFNGDFGFIACMNSIEHQFKEGKSYEDIYIDCIRRYLFIDPFYNSMMITTCEYLIGLIKDENLKEIIEFKLGKL